MVSISSSRSWCPVVISLNVRICDRSSEVSSSCVTIIRKAKFGALGAYVRLSFTGRSSVRLFVCYLCINQVGKLNFGAAKNDTRNGEKVKPKVVGASMRFTGPLPELKEDTPHFVIHRSHLNLFSEARYHHNRYLSVFTD